MVNNYYKEWKLNPLEYEKRLLDIAETFKVDVQSIKYYSQQDEDKYIIQYILKEKINDGVFLEIGACDGVLYSNTKTLEDYFGFNGILIEPQREFFNALKSNRPNCKLVNSAVSSSNSKYIKFEGSGATGGITNTLNITYDKRKKGLIGTVKSTLGLLDDSYKVPNNSMDNILRNSDFDYVDIMIIDVEGGELELLKSIDFSFPIYCIIIEAHSAEKDKNELFHQFLLRNKFQFVERQRGNEVWINPNYFRRGLFAL